MEILLILILLTLVYIALQLRKLAKPTVDIDKPLNTTTLTPVFSETEIRENKDLAQTWQEQVKKLLMPWESRTRRDQKIHGKRRHD